MRYQVLFAGNILHTTDNRVHAHGIVDAVIRALESRGVGVGLGEIRIDESVSPLAG